MSLNFHVCESEQKQTETKAHLEAADQHLYNETEVSAPPAPFQLQLSLISTGNIRFSGLCLVTDIHADLERPLIGIRSSSSSKPVVFMMERGCKSMFAAAEKTSAQPL